MRRDYRLVTLRLSYYRVYRQCALCPAEYWQKEEHRVIFDNVDPFDDVDVFNVWHEALSTTNGLYMEDIYSREEGGTIISWGK